MPFVCFESEGALLVGLFHSRAHCFEESLGVGFCTVCLERRSGSFERERREREESGKSGDRTEAAVSTSRPTQMLVGWFKKIGFVMTLQVASNGVPSNQSDAQYLWGK